MKKIITVAIAILTLAAGVTAANLTAITTANAKAAPHYDCTKKGNANKAACKSSAAAVAAPSANVTAPSAAPAKKPGLMSGFLHPTGKPQSTPDPSTTAASKMAEPSGGHPVCKKGKPCGNSCIAMTKTCHKS